jgi:halimadienyl-diphosphate synthase
LAWLLAHQNPDGSFGTTLPIAKERLLSTICAVLALDDLPQGLQDSAVHRARVTALRYLSEETRGWQSGPDTAGFEIILPALLEEAQARQLPIPYDRFTGIRAQSDAKLGRLPQTLVYTVATPLLYSLEYLGPKLQVGLARRQLAGNGSFANSPSATAFFLTHAEEPACRAYLDGIAAARPDGSFPSFAPFEVFQNAWVLSSLARAGFRPAAAQERVRDLARALGEDGVGISRDGLRPDGDDTALTLGVLAQYGYPVSAAPLKPFEGVDFYLTFPLERDPSITTNAHALEVLSACSPFGRRDTIMQKVIRFLAEARVEGAYWVDKWHASPLYATAHALFALFGPEPDLCRPALAWLTRAQRSDGSWGWYEHGTAEETAYAVQAWLAAPAHLREGLSINLDAAATYLEESEGVRHSELWIAKTMFAPLTVIDAAVLGARIQLAGRTHNA